VLVREQSANKNLVQASVGGPADSSTRWVKWPSTETVIFLLAAVALAAFGWWLLPSATPPHIAPGFVIGARYLDTVSIGYSEDHPRDNAIDGTVSATLGKVAPVGSKLEIFIGLPDKVTYRSCETADSNIRVKCFGNEVTAWANVSFLHRGKETSVLFHLSGPGLGFVESDGQVAVELPRLADVKSGAFSGVEYHIKDAASYQWSGEQPFPGIEGAIWEESNATLSNHQVVASGVREDVQSRNSDLTFIAGVIVGIAGAALIAAGQAVFKWLAHE